jgi:pimeloyl-ACP methyl ester carboxylesterase
VALRRSALVVIAICVSGCTGLQATTGTADLSHMEVDGIGLADRSSDTSREVISMLGLEKICSRPTIACADQILSAPGTVRRGTRKLAAAEQLYRHALRSQTHRPQDGWLGCAQNTDEYLRAPDLPGRRGALEGRSQLALHLHNACVAGLLTSLEAGDADPSVHLRWEVDEHSFPRAAVQRIVLASGVAVSGMRTRQYDDGLGVAAVAIGKTHETLGTFPPQPFALAVNVRFEPEDENRAALVVSDASHSRSIETQLGPISLARDMTAAYALAAVEFEREESAWTGLRGSGATHVEAELRLLAPRDDTRTPVVLIHGLASSPLTWVNVANELLGDPDISEHYEVWLARYSTGLPLLVNRQFLAQRLDDARGNVPGMVLVGHSMGGILARLLATDSGEALWNTAFTCSPEELHGKPSDVQATRALFVFDHVDRVDEIVMVAAPHGGSTLADRTLGKIVRGLIKLPPHVLEYLTNVTRLNRDRISPDLRQNYLEGGPKSLDTLSPNQPVIRAARQLPVSASVRVHSIIGIKNPDRPEDGDGLVSYASAHWPVGSEQLVTGDHELHRKPATALIIKQILLDRLDRLRNAPPTPVAVVDCEVCR